MTMKPFTNHCGDRWVATAREESTPRHHGRWYLVFHTEDEPDSVYPMPEVRWQTFESADRTLRTMSEFELRRRLDTVLGRTAPVREGIPP
jgi:hypothetical protein